ncbi:MAG: isoprenylcysteine carboxylmethyltransferase family protein [Thermoplasmata archaeon]
MLGLLIVQVLAGVTLATLLGGFLLGHALEHPPRRVARVVTKRDPARGTEVGWVVGAMVATFWSIGVLLAPAYAYHWPSVPDFPESGVVQLLGFGAAISGGLLFFAAVRALGRHMTPAIQVEEGHRLVQEGPYRYIRHPAYTAIVTGAGGLSVLYLSIPLALITTVLVGMAVYRAHLEEDLLGSPEAFGEAYAAYVSRTGRFLPRIRSRP